MKIFTKILFVLLIMISLLFGSLYLLLQWSFNQGMLDYINQKELQSLSLLSENLINVHHELGDLTQLKQQTKIWHETLKASLEERTITADEIKAMLTNPRLGRRNERDVPTRNNFRNTQLPADFDERRNERLQGRTDIEQTNRPLHLAREHRPLINNKSGLNPSRFPSLLDTNKQSIIGRVTPHFSFLAIKNNSQIIGYLALPPTQTLDDAFDVAFSKSQQHAWLVILLGAFMITFFVSVVLSRYLVKSIQTINHATNQLNNGDYRLTLKPKGHDEIANLARNVNDLANTLSHNEHSRKTWLANISHELRTPLAVVKGEIEALQDGIRPTSPENLQSLADEVSHLQTLIDDLNQLANAEIGALNYQKQVLELNTLITQTIHRRQRDIERAGLELAVNTPKNSLSIWADETRLNQLLDNIITNTIKYTDSPGKVIVTVEKKAQQALISFSDSAPTVPTDALPQLFNHLFRVENSRNRKTGGSGLGLAICEKIVQAHQGNINASTNNLGGLTITISLPLL